MSMSHEPMKVIIDTDPGVDDVFAISWALMDPRIEVLALTLVQGNTSLPKVFRNTRQILQVVQAESVYQRSLPTPTHTVDLNDWPVIIALGQGAPLVGDALFAEHFHGADGCGEFFSRYDTAPFPEHESNPNSPPPSRAYMHASGLFPIEPADPAASSSQSLYTLSPRLAEDEILHHLASHPPNTITILALGPLSNLARAMAKSFETFHRAARIIIMGGAIHVPGNITPTAEFNFYSDSHAAHYVLKHARRTPPSSVSSSLTSAMTLDIVPIDTTHQVTTIHHQDLLHHLQGQNSLVRSSPLSQYIMDITRFVFDHLSKIGAYEVAFHDPVIVACLLYSDLCEFECHNFEVEPSGSLTRGMCVVDRREASLFGPVVPLDHLRVGTVRDERRFLQLMFRDVFGGVWEPLPLDREKNKPT